MKEGRTTSSEAVHRTSSCSRWRRRSSGAGWPRGPRPAIAPRVGRDVVSVSRRCALLEWPTAWPQPTPRSSSRRERHGKEVLAGGSTCVAAPRPVRRGHCARSRGAVESSCSARRGAFTGRFATARRFRQASGGNGLPRRGGRILGAAGEAAATPQRGCRSGGGDAPVRGRTHRRTRPTGPPSRIRDGSFREESLTTVERRRARRPAAAERPTTSPACYALRSNSRRRRSRFPANCRGAVEAPVAGQLRELRTVRAMYPLPGDE